jgi:DNA polymerase-3 subunit gamma/tau
MSEKSFIALYRKYRPKNFKEVSGQDHVVKVLEGAIKNETISHAYLFAGSRGLGKTSVARIFAKELDTKPHDIYEIDAASNRGIDDIRELRESVGTLPFDSKYKVYIIDEVHMLTKEAFNALLKTLEEPPSHAIFILATTETDKLPETVVSRCQVFLFKKPNQNLLSEMIVNVAKKEGLSLEAGVSGLIALLGDGSFRDTLGTLEKIAGSISSKKITIKDVEVITGAPRGQLVNDFITGLAKGDKEVSLSALQNAVSLSIDMKVYTTLIIEKIRFILLLKNAKGIFKDSITRDLSEEDFAFISEMSNNNDSKITSKTLKDFLNTYLQIGKMPLPEIGLELAIIESV